jgi:hypothetical protein
VADISAGLPAAASALLRPSLTGAGRAGHVLAAFPTAVYLAVEGEVVAVVTSDGLRLPGSLVVAASSRTGPFATVRVGDRAVVGAGAVQAGALHLVVRRWWRPTGPVRRGSTAQWAASAETVARLLPPVPAPLPADLVGTAPADLLGLGPGLTPAGDDVLAGMLVTPNQPRPPELLAVVRAAATRTTTLSATLLRHASLGYAVPPLVRLLDAMSDPTTTDLGRAVDELLAVGHTSGAALAHGVVTAVRAGTPERKVA